MATNGGSNGNGRPGSSNVVPWVSIVIALGAGFWAVANPRDDIKSERIDRIDGLRQQRMDIDSELKRVITRDQYNEFVLREDREISRVQSTLDEMRKGLVSREEHVQHWKEIDDKHDSLRQQVYELRRDFTGSYNIGDQLKSIQKQIDDIRLRRDTVTTMTPGAVTTVRPSPP